MGHYTEQVPGKAPGILFIFEAAMPIFNPPATLEIAKELGLLPEEYDTICQYLGRTPNYTELSIYSVMWSEHCSYKNSIRWLKTLPREGSRLLAKAGEENAGLVDIGDGWACAFKIESHNHPSAIEPYQGAATGVGGIHRDIFTMGARPVAALNSLRFGNLDEPKTQHLLRGVVKGIGDYGNAFGVATVAGEVFFDACYNTNPLVNAMSVGLVKVGHTVSAVAYGAGNPVFIVGSATGKDGIHGATFASADISEDSAERLPSVQVGDPFQEKLLLEASLEAIATGAIVGMQDMGAAGITCSTSEMSAKGESGMIIHLDKVPTRQKNMQPFEILLSESQERMLIVGKKGEEAKLQAVFDKWDLNCVQIGEVINEDRVKYYMNGELVADVPAQSLVLGGGAPVYERAYKEPAYFKELEKFTINNIALPTDYRAAAEKLISAPNIASKKWIYTQYDNTVGTNSVSPNSPSDAAIIRIKGLQKGLALTVDCNARFVNADPYKGTMIAVAEAARNIVCSGGVPSGVTNCLNFGNPYNQEVYWQFVQAIKGMGDACKAFDTPVTGGNVSFYNQSSDDGPVFPTPTIGMMGVLDDMNYRMGLSFTMPDDIIYLLGSSLNDLGCSEYLVHVLGIDNSPAPNFEIGEEVRLQKCVTEVISKKYVQSAHDCADGGLFVALLESGFFNGLGFDIVTDKEVRKDAYLFGEAQSRVVVSVSSINGEAFETLLKTYNQTFSLIGRVTRGAITIDGEDWHDIDHWKNIYDNVIGNVMQKQVEMV